MSVSDTGTSTSASSGRCTGSDGCTIQAALYDANGTNDGQLQVTRDAGGRWTNVTANIPGLPPWGTVSNIEPSRFDNGTAYVTVDLHQSTFDVDERAIGVGVHVMAATALNALWDDNTRVTEPLPNAAALEEPVTPL